MNFEKQLAEIGIAVYNVAQEIFEDCMAADDFCVQATTLDSAVFGGTNRLLWRPLDGFQPDRSYCSLKFLENWDRLYE